MKILFLCNKKYWLRKMSRVRFHAMDAIGRHPKIELFKSGPGFDGFVDCGASVETYKPDVVIWYKPLGMPGFEKVLVPKVIQYNEMWDLRHTKHEIVESKSDIVICHHQNDIKNYTDLAQAGHLFLHCPHCGEKEVFKDYGIAKDIDVLLIGIIRSNIYPLRSQMKSAMLNHLTQYKCKVLNHPGYRINDVNGQVVKYAQMISRSKIVLGCASRYHYALAKYIEVGLCGSVLCADVPDERQEWYRKWMLEVPSNATAEQIANTIKDALQKPDLIQNMSQTGQQLCLESMTQEHYAQRMVDYIKEYLKK